MNKLVSSTLTAMLLCAGTISYAQTPDGQTPAIETGCDGQSGAAFGLCNAYCEPMDCDGDLPQASDWACERIRADFIKITGSDVPSCSGLPQAGDPCDAMATIQFAYEDAWQYGCDATNYPTNELRCIAPDYPENPNWYCGSSG